MAALAFHSPPRAQSMAAQRLARLSAHMVVAPAPTPAPAAATSATARVAVVGLGEFFTTPRMQRPAADTS